MSQEAKTTAAASESEVVSIELQHQPSRKIRLVDGARVGLTILALLSSITILGTSGHSLNVYNTTAVSISFLPLWPDKFDVRPTVALVIGGVIVALVNIVSLAFSRTPSLRSRASIHTPLTFVAPFIGFVASMIAMIFFYAVNASTTADTLQSWSCRWESLEMTVQPYFGTLCHESKTALYLSVILVPIEAVILSLAGYQLSLERKVSAIAQIGKRNSPTPSA